MAVRANMTISVPPDLKKKMDKIKGVNWSKMACKAYEKHLVDLKKANESEDLPPEVVLRWKQLKEEDEEDLKKEGTEVGRRWCHRYATRRQVKNIVRQFEEKSLYQWLGNEDPETFDWWTAIAGVALGDEQPNGSEIKDFWESFQVEYNDNRLKEPEFIEGIIDAVMAFYDAVSQT